jgi:hypothetical protein
MSQTKSQADLEMQKVEDDSQADAPEVDDEQESLFDSGAMEGPAEDKTDSSYPDGESRTGGSQGGGSGSLEEFGVEEDPSPNNTRLDNPDGGLEEDRRTNTHSSPDETEQEALFPDIDNKNQVTLTGDRAYNQCLFEQD